MSLLEQNLAMHGLRIGVLGTLVTLVGCGETKVLELFPKPQPMMPQACGAEPKCPPERPVCAADQCVECVADADCAGGKGTCTEQVCTECRSDEQCPMDKVCFSDVGRCTERCTEAAECKDKERSVCRVEGGFCVACLVDTDCKPDRVCDERDYSCVRCADDLDCGDAGTCDPMRRECRP